MNNQRKRELKEAYRTSRPPMGVLSFRCAPTGEVEVLEELDYRDESDDPADYKEELEQLRDLCLERDESASLLWK